MGSSYIIGRVLTKDKEILTSIQCIKNAVKGTCKQLSLNVVGDKYHIFRIPNGITYCFILSQSHFVVHTWPEDSTIFIDIFTCNKNIDEEKLVDVISKQFRGKIKEIRKVYFK